jgi:hypothetical protein
MEPTCMGPTPYMSWYKIDIHQCDVKKSLPYLLTAHAICFHSHIF